MRARFGIIGCAVALLLLFASTNGGRELIGESFSVAGEELPSPSPATAAGPFAQLQPAIAPALAEPLTIPTIFKPLAPIATPTPEAPSVSRVVPSEFASRTLGRTMPYYIYLPPGYDSEPTRRYPVLYLLHGIGGHADEWIAYGAPATADTLIASGAAEPFIMVFPQGDQGYWVDQTNGGPQWATYVARDVVTEIDFSYRTLTDREDRAIGGLSMGAHGALQIAINFPALFGIVGAHSPSLRVAAEMPVYFGTVADQATRDPRPLYAARPEVARTLAIWLDYGSNDFFGEQQVAFEQELTAEGIPHEFHQFDGNHEPAYWVANVGTYLQFYARTFAHGR